MSGSSKSNDALIIAYLTGQASESESLQFQARIGTDSDFQAEVERLETWLAPLNSDIEDISPPEGLLEAIMLDIGGTDTPNADLPFPANDRGRLVFWRGLAIAASAAALLSLGSHWITPNQESFETDRDRYLAVLSGDSTSPLVAIVYNPTTGQVVARLSNVEIPEDGDLQLWLIRDGSAGPVSLGLLDRTDQGRVELDIPESLNAQTDLLAVSLEAKGGSQSAGPEGPVLYTGSVSALD